MKFFGLLLKDAIASLLEVVLEVALIWAVAIAGFGVFYTIVYIVGTTLH